MKSKKTILIILIFIFAMIPYARALTPQSQTVKITDTHDDRWILETGVGIDSTLVSIKDPSMDLRAYLVFRDIDVNYWEPLKNATLRLHTSSSLPSDPDSSITIYGMKISDLQDEGFISASTVLSIGFTSANTVYNTSEFSGSKWNEIDVTEIVDELIRNPNWDGDGIDGSETGDAIGFHILGAEGDDKRYFYDLSAGNGMEAQLVIHWNHEPPPPSFTAPPPYNDTDVWHWDYFNSSRGLDIWTVTQFGDIEIQYMDDQTLTYHNSSTGTSGEVDWSDSSFSYVEGGHTEPILCVDDLVFLIGDNASSTIYYSDDEFSAGSIRTAELSHQFPDLDPYQGNYGSIVLDQNDTTTFHVVWSTVTAWQTGSYNVIYANFTLNEDGSLQWSSDYVNITKITTTQFEPDIYSQKDGTLHLVWWGHQGQTHDQIWYMRRYPNGTWGEQVRISDDDLEDSSRPDVVANEDTGDALIVWWYMTSTKQLRWDLVFENNTDGPDRTVTANGHSLSMANDRENNVAHVAYEVKEGSSYQRIQYIYKSINNESAWSASVLVSPATEKHIRPSLGIDEANSTIAVIWSNAWNERTAHSTWQIGDTPPIENPTICTEWFLYLNQPDYYQRNVAYTFYFISYPNGTVINGPIDDPDDIDLAIDEELGPDPEDPDPPSEGWDETGPFTRFRMRLYILIMGISMLLGPPMFFAYRRPSGYTFIVGLLIMIIGFALMIHVGSI